MNGAQAGWTTNSAGTRMSCSGDVKPAPTSNSTRDTSVIATTSAITTADGDQAGRRRAAS